MRLTLLMVMVMVMASSSAHARVYKCEIGGSVVYSERPCSETAALKESRSPPREESPQETAARIQAEYEQEKKDKAAARAKAAQAEADRKVAIDRCRVELSRRPVVMNNGWDGGVSQAERYIKRILREPDSFDAIRWGAVQRDCDGYSVLVEYRARNGFGGMGVEIREVQMDTGGNVTGSKVVR